MLVNNNINIYSNAFGAMTVKDMGLLQEQISNNMNTSALLGITLIMDICNIVIGICVQVAASDN